MCSSISLSLPLYSLVSDDMFSLLDYLKLLGQLLLKWLFCLSELVARSGGRNRYITSASQYVQLAYLEIYITVLIRLHSEKWLSVPSAADNLQDVRSVVETATIQQ